MFVPPDDCTGENREKVPMHAANNLIEALDQKIAEHHLLKSPFYQAWTAGTLTRETLAHYAAQYYRHIEAFPGYLWTLAERSDDSLRPLVGENLAEELDPTSPHPQLWRDFAAAVGADGATLDAAEPLPAVKALVETYQDLCANGSPTEAVAALYAYEAQVPEIAVQKMDGLRRHYGISEPAALRYFAVHAEADVRHRAAWREWLAVQDPAVAQEAVAAAERGLRALWNALEAVHSGPCAN
jgi:pyrroloquinoline-quinone synthase